ncbi:hypothetical protein AWE51_05370 [Aquimarina aggregata]|uniref:DinB-like domain-containing protein n=1 Tax=Aquimarina aggregata TaxID=1642818 RepID=A0A162FAP6_9FLAO|nr:DinB family protein [Aquimarina aggregata]KZS40386.1 hypothetical protein AWE51_05370 [Aquimarina aggregata]
MNKEQLIHEFKSVHSLFIDDIEVLDEHDFVSYLKGKWSAGQQLEHIYLSVKPLIQVFLLPKFILKIFFGKAKRESISYDAMITKYSKVLEQGGKATSKYIPKKITIQQRAQLAKSLKSTIDTLLIKIKSTKDQDLDEILVPHPLMGKLTLREMLYFSIYHAKHHHKSLKKNIVENKI